MKPNHAWILALVALAVAGLVFARKSAKEEAAEAAQKADIAFNQAVSTQNFDAFKDLIAEDAVFYGSRGRTEGRAAVAEKWTDFFLPEEKGSLTWAPRTAVASASGDLAYTLGVWEGKGKNAKGEAVVKHGEYVTIWRKGADGKWRAAVDIGTQGQ